MKNNILILAAFLCAAMVFAADPVEGFWTSIDEKSNKVTAAWEVYQKDGVLYGEIRSIADKPPTQLAEECKGPYKNFPIAGDTAKMTVVNVPWIFGLKQKNEGAWVNGHIVDPNDGKFYGCEITFRPADGKKYTQDTLEMRGKVGPFGRSQFWVRTTKEDAYLLYKD